MKQLLEKNEKEILHEDRSILTSPLQRRSFLQFAGASAAGIALIAAGCTKDKIDTPPPMQTGVTLDFKDDFGVLNYAYALEQLEAAFYIKIASAPPSDFTAEQKAYFQDIQFHEIAHREYLKKALGTAAVGGLEVDFSSINFSSKASVLGAAKTFEDLGVAAYNGAGRRLTTPMYLLAAGKIVSVEARHAAYIRDLITPGSFAGSDVVNGSGLDRAFSPTEVLAAAGMYIKTKINVVNLTTLS